MQRALIAVLLTGLIVSSSPAQESRQATGVKVGEVTDTSAIVWMRVTANAKRNAAGPVRKGKPADLPPPDKEVDKLHGACPDAVGWVRPVMSSYATSRARTSAMRRRRRG